MGVSLILGAASSLLTAAVLASNKKHILLGVYVIFQIAPLVFSIWGFFVQKKWFKFAYPSVLWVGVAIWVIAAATASDMEVAVKGVVSGIFALAWTIYFMKSRRVKETFIR